MLMSRLMSSLNESSASKSDMFVTFGTLPSLRRPRRRRIRERQLDERRRRVVVALKSAIKDENASDDAATCS